MKEKEISICVIQFSYFSLNFIFCKDVPICITKNDEDTLNIINYINNYLNPNRDRERKIYLLEYNYSVVKHFFEKKEWVRLKKSLSKGGFEKLEKIEEFLILCEKGIWN